MIRQAMTQVTRTCALFLFAAVMPLRAQDNYEIQVYGSDTVAKGATMVELHSNYSSEHQTHLTLEVTHGFSTWFETGFYLFNDASAGDFVGWHVRPRVRAPAQWNWPVGVSLSGEIGYIKKEFSAETWTWELRPIIDKEIGRWYFSFNPAFENHFDFEPAFNVKYDVTPKIAAGIEYYGSPDEQQFFPAIDLNVSPRWEFNAGVGYVRRHESDGWLVKMIIGRRFQ
jgi:hypothetical protein